MILQVECHPPQIRTIKLAGFEKQYPIALPEIHSVTYIPEDASSNIGIYFQFQGNFYSNIDPQFRPTYLREISKTDPLGSFLSAKMFRNYFFNPIPINSNLSIHSFLQWSELTQQNPDFMREQFDPNFAIQMPELYACPGKNLALEFTADYFARNHQPGKESSDTFAKLQPPNTRTLQLESSRTTPISMIKLSLPKIALVQITGINNPLCLLHTRNNTYVPLGLPNVDPLGSVCMGTYNPLTNPLDYFWHSTFSREISFRIYLNPNLIVSSLQHWQELTQINPNFFQQQLDPNFAEQNAAITYQLQPIPNSNQYSLHRTLQ